MKRSEVKELLLEMSWHVARMKLSTTPSIVGVSSKEQRKAIGASAMSDREVEVLKLAIEDALLTALYLLEEGREPVKPKEILGQLVSAVVEEALQARLKEKGVAVVVSEAK